MSPWPSQGHQQQGPCWLRLLRVGWGGRGLPGAMPIFLTSPY